jgi:hypothetical protein
MAPGRDRLSSNLAAHSYALGQQAELPPSALDVNIGTPRRGTRDVRQADPTAGRGTEAAHRPVLIRGREETGQGRLQTFARNAMQYLGAGAGIQTRRMRED